MLGMRLREGLDVAALQRELNCTFDRRVIDEMVSEGLTLHQGARIVPTLRGRLLNDTLISSILSGCSLIET